MRELPEDIIEEMKTRFGSEFNSAIKILAEYLEKYNYLDSDRIVRCSIFLTQNRIEHWKSNLDSAKTDPRDIMFWAEYENRNDDKPNRVRDFNKTFAENNVKTDY